jgi:hypothetical protein
MSDISHYAEMASRIVFHCVDDRDFSVQGDIQDIGAPFWTNAYAVSGL